MPAKKISWLTVFTECGFDVIVVSRFLDRTLGDAIIEVLKPDGLLFYQTFGSM